MLKSVVLLQVNCYDVSQERIQKTTQDTAKISRVEDTVGDTVHILTKSLSKNIDKLKKIFVRVLP